MYDAYNDLHEQTNNLEFLIFTNNFLFRLIVTPSLICKVEDWVFLMTVRFWLGYTF